MQVHSCWWLIVLVLQLQPQQNRLSTSASGSNNTNKNSLCSHAWTLLADRLNHLQVIDRQMGGFVEAHYTQRLACRSLAHTSTHFFGTTRRGDITTRDIVSHRLVIFFDQFLPEPSIFTSIVRSPVLLRQSRSSRVRKPPTVAAILDLSRNNTKTNQVTHAHNTMYSIYIKRCATRTIEAL